jgi:hypothetical protein
VPLLLAHAVGWDPNVPGNPLIRAPGAVYVKIIIYRGISNYFLSIRRINDLKIFSPFFKRFALFAGLIL